MLSDEYRKLIEEVHRTTNWGDGAFGFAERIDAFAKETKCRTVLDYGAGQQTLAMGLKEINSNLEVIAYDPGIPSLANNRTEADMVVCLDVIEHIEPEYLSEVMADIKNLARKAVYLHIAVSPAKQILPDGRNAHLIVKSFEFWQGYLRTWWGQKNELRIINHKGVLAWGVKK